MTNEKWKSLIENARKKRSKESKEDKSELIKIHQDILEKILSTPTISHCKYFLLVMNFLIQEELHIYWKARIKRKGKNPEQKF